MQIPFEVDPPKNKEKKLKNHHNSFPNNSNSSIKYTEKQTHKPISVTLLTKQISLLLEAEFRSLVVEGELSNVKMASSGHLYFILKDNHSQIRGVMFRQFTSNTHFEPENGLEVIVRGHLSVYKQRGEYQIIISSIEPKGLGSLQLAFEQLKNKLNSEGLFDQEHKKEIPFLPRKIGIVTSPTGAVIHDMITVLERRFAEIQILLFPAKVQGDLAVESLVEGIEYFNNLHDSQKIDVLIIARGGGSIEDLWAFNDEKLARTIFSSNIPIISAIGHETDFTISDFVCDLRAPTPSAAIELAIPNKQDLKYTLEQKQSRLNRSIIQKILRLKEYSNLVSQRLVSPINFVRQNTQLLDDLDSSMRERISRRISDLKNYADRIYEKISLLNPKRELTSYQHSLFLLEKRLKQSIGFFQKNYLEIVRQQQNLLSSLSPLSVLHRGYSVVMNTKGELLSSVNDIKTGVKLKIQMKDGIIQTRVISSKSKNSL